MLDTVLRGLTILLVVATALAVPLLVLAASGRGSISVSGTLDAPFTIDLADGRLVGVGNNGMTFEDFPVGDESASLSGAPQVSASVRMQRGDTDSRLIVIALAAVWLAAAWVGLRGARALVDSAMRGELFARENPGRLRLLASAILAVPAAGLVAQLMLGTTINTDLPFRISIAVSTWVVLGVVGLAVMALAQPFAEAARLREFEESTI